MDLSKNLVLKENYTFFVADESGNAIGGEHGLYNRDTRFLSRYLWDFGGGFQTLLAYAEQPDHFAAHCALIEGPSQIIGVARKLKLDALGFSDELSVENTSSRAQKVRLELTFAADFRDLFEVRGGHKPERSVEIVVRAGETGQGVKLSYRAQDDLDFATVISFSEAPAGLEPDRAIFELTLAPKETRCLKVRVGAENPLEQPIPAISYEAWRKGFSLASPVAYEPVLERALDDLRALLLFTEHGPIPAAGIPWYVAAFGRDALLTAYMLLPHHPEVAVGTLRTLAAHQGKQYDSFRAEAPGKIMHELRYGELTRTSRTPHGPYYGTIDANALFLMLLHETWQQTGDLTLVKELKPNWEAALSWMLNEGDLDGDGFLEFAPGEAGRGLAVQSWKDSADSMSHADGTLATGPLAVSEVQGYAFAAYRAAAAFYEALGSDEAERWRDRAKRLQTEFQRAFWLEAMRTYALALDGNKKPLKVHNSDAGQLLWSGIVPGEVASKLVKSLFSTANWSSWGIRTLGAGEVRYNPVSYHNGSVWPHDNALIAGGLARYGFAAEVEKIRRATFDLAASQRDLRLPELVAGYARTSAPPVPYPVACRPQAWDAAALLYLLRL